METTKVERKAPASDAEWTVQCMGSPAGFCGLVLEGPLAGLRIMPRLPYASSGLCVDCAAVYAKLMRARRSVE